MLKTGLKMLKDRSISRLKIQQRKENCLSKRKPNSPTIYLPFAMRPNKNNVKNNTKKKKKSISLMGNASIVSKPDTYGIVQAICY